MNTFDYLKLLVSYYQDKVQAESLEKLRCKYQELLEADAEARRRKKSVLISEMANLQIALTKFKIAYVPIKNRCGEVESVEKKIKSMENLIKEYSRQKNR